jgi:hypothetical protein
VVSLCSAGERNGASASVETSSKKNRNGWAVKQGLGCVAAGSFVSGAERGSGGSRIITPLMFTVSYELLN